VDQTSSGTRGRTPPFLAVKRPARPCESATQARFTIQNAEGGSTPPGAGPAPSTGYSVPAPVGLGSMRGSSAVLSIACGRGRRAHLRAPPVCFAARITEESYSCRVGAEMAPAPAAGRLQLLRLARHLLLRGVAVLGLAAPDGTGGLSMDQKQLDL
jgi:hypothetical protein